MHSYLFSTLLKFVSYRIHFFVLHRERETKVQMMLACIKA